MPRNRYRLPIEILRLISSVNLIAYFLFLSFSVRVFPLLETIGRNRPVGV
jgi:hypothetical protein